VFRYPLLTGLAVARQYETDGNYASSGPDDHVDIGVYRLSPASESPESDKLLELTENQRSVRAPESE
jgi:hypothetical protein